MAILVLLRGWIALVPAVVWKWLAIIALIVAAYLYVDTKATLRERAVQVAKCEAAARAAEKAADAQDKLADQAVRKDEEDTVEELLEDKRKADAEIEQLKSDLAKLAPSDRCPITEPMSKRLR